MHEKRKHNEAKIVISNFHQTKPNVNKYEINMNQAGMNARNKTGTFYHEKKS